MGFDDLPAAALRMLEIRSLLVTLEPLHLADRICAEYGVDLEDLKTLTLMEQTIRELNRKPDED